MFDASRTILTGGSGLLGTALRELLPELRAPSHSEFDITDFEGMDQYVAKGSYAGIVHAAAFTSPPQVDKDPAGALEANIGGTVNVARICLKHNLRMVYISTDYVFRGDKGNYAEDDPVLPVNKYAWSKLGGECAVRLLDGSLIIRTSFGPDDFPYPKAFIDQWTSRENVSTAADLIARALKAGVSGTLHVGGPRRSVYEYAHYVSPDKEIGELRRNDVSFAVPADTSLDTSRYQREIGVE